MSLADFATFARNWGVAGEPTGSLQVTISPQAALDLGAKWRIIGGDWQLSSNMLLDIPVGSYAVEFSSIDTWIQPAQQIIEVLEDLISDARVSYKYPAVISEFLASNSGGARDPQGQDGDRIEMYNFGNQAIDIGGMYLTDNSGNPKKWQIPDVIPEATTIAPNGYLIIWADRAVQDNINATSGLHVDFRLDGSGDDISLFDSTGTILIDNIEFTDQDANISYGRYPDGNDTWQFFPFPTPGHKNIGA